MNLVKYKFPGLREDEIPIGGYVSPTPEHPLAPGRKSQITDEVYKKVKESGLNFLCAVYEIFPQSEKDGMAALELAGKYGLKILVRDDRFEYRSEIPKGYSPVAKKFASMAGFGGIHLCDEPSAAYFEKLASFKREFGKLFSSDFCCYINLFPMYASAQMLKGKELPPGGKYTYEDYIDDYLRIVKPEFLSYDFYPMQGKFPAMMDHHFVQLDIIRRKTVEAKIPFWSFIQMTSWADTVRLPTLPEVMYQISTALAYGAKGIQYFSYATPINGDVPEGERFKQAVLDANGEPTERYYFMQYANRHLRSIQKVIANSDSLGIILVGASPKEVPQDSLIELPWAKFFGRHLLIGVFDWAGHTMLYVVNNSITEADTAVCRFDKKYNVNLIIDDKFAEFASDSVAVTIPAGEGCMLILSEEKIEEE